MLIDKVKCIEKKKSSCYDKKTLLFFLLRLCITIQIIGIFHFKSVKVIRTIICIKINISRLCQMCCKFLSKWYANMVFTFQMFKNISSNVSGDIQQNE